MNIRLKRAYDPPEKSDGTRILVDRLWPRGLRKEKAHIDIWLKEIAPTTELRKWFGHDAKKWPQFVARYRSELGAHSEQLDLIRKEASKRAVTLIYAARDTEHNEAVVLKKMLEKSFRRTAR